MSEVRSRVASTLGLTGSGCLLALGGCAGAIYFDGTFQALTVVGGVVFVVGVVMFLAGLVQKMTKSSQ